ncbi:NAD(P)/FAD-dependent oxidoreductase [Flavobacterium cucumis]|uniref:Dehydrogenase (Flavoprotein) n=1 Tax=Flavobacterium cucumis TaxID=416016 RepID=A0A1M7ZZ23_9FLAO|nr:NAD(P)/FAD-dependent oxidoreductase [Flavobacterium cucumis]SHO74106.1 Dehydrogenase (flavoprotein) [Flavobacterium cucumis]
MNTTNEISIIGGGLAGLTAAIDLLNRNFKVVVFEKNEYPKHKVCGEFISNEVLPYLEKLGLQIESLQPTQINKTELSTHSGKIIEAKLPLGGFGISRYKLDAYLAEKVIERGGTIVFDTVTAVAFSENNFSIVTQSNEVFQSKVVLGAFGKRSNLDKELKRGFMQQKSPWLGVKAHYKGNFPNDLVGLHNFYGGYCGISKVENNTINICYLVQFESFKKYKNITDFQENVLYQNKKIKKILKEATLVFDKPITISQISFEDKSKIENHIIMLGDSAGLIHPLCGNGMAMAIHSAKIACDLVSDFLQNKITRPDMETRYVEIWDKMFKRRLQFGKFLSKLLLNPYITQVTLNVLIVFPFILPIIIKKTHGRPL